MNYCLVHAAIKQIYVTIKTSVLTSQLRLHSYIYLTVRHIYLKKISNVSVMIALQLSSAAFHHSTCI